MKRKQLLVFAIIAFALALTFGVGGSLIYAQGQFSGYKSTIQTYNMSDTTANVILAFYRQDGSLEKTLTDIIERDRSKIYFTLPVAEGFTGSVVISSNQPVAALSSMMNSGLTAGGTYLGRSQGSTTVFLPLLMANQDGGFNSWFTLQNASASSTNVTVNYSDGITTTITLEAHASHNFYQNQEPHTSKVFAAEITSDEPVVAVVFQEDAGSLAAYSGFASGATNPVMPVINANNNGFNTDIQIQNTGDTDTSVTVSYMPSAAGTACTETQTIAANQTVEFTGGAFADGSNSTCTRRRAVHRFGPCFGQQRQPASGRRCQSARRQQPPDTLRRLQQFQPGRRHQDGALAGNHGPQQRLFHHRQCDERWLGRDDGRVLIHRHDLHDQRDAAGQRDADRPAGKQDSGRLCGQRLLHGER